MPKIKTNRGALKRFRITAKGKIKRKRAFSRHILTGKPSKRKRRLRRPDYVEGANLKAIKKFLPYG